MLGISKRPSATLEKLSGGDLYISPWPEVKWQRLTRGDGGDPSSTNGVSPGGDPSSTNGVSPGGDPPSTNGVSPGGEKFSPPRGRWLWGSNDILAAHPRSQIAGWWWWWWVKWP